MTITVPVIRSIVCTFALKLEDFPKSTLLKLNAATGVVGGCVDGDTVVEVVVGVKVGAVGVRVMVEVEPVV